MPSFNVCFFFCNLQLKDSEKEWEVCVDRANAKHEEFERLKVDKIINFNRTD